MNIKHAFGVRSDFSIGESMMQTDQIVKKAKELGYESVAIVDTMSINAMIDFGNKAKKENIKPIVGCRIRVYDDPKYRPPAARSGVDAVPNPMFAIKAFALNENGLKSIMKLLTKGSSADYFYYHSRVGLAEVLELEDVAISTGDLFGLFRHAKATDILRQLQGCFGPEKVFVELVPIDTPLFDTLNAKALTAAAHCSAETLVTYPVFYPESGDAKTLEVLGCIATNTPMSAPYRSVQFVQDFQFVEPDKLLERVKGAVLRGAKWHGMRASGAWTQGITNIEKLASMCEYQFKKKPPCLPAMADDEFGELAKKCVSGWRARLLKPILGYMPDNSMLTVYKDRLSYELATLKKMGFSGYFLLVEDLVMWAKKNGVIVGPGRGSVGGSLVAYLLGITDVDPIRFNLLFERFINPERLDLPDADLDFMSSKRHLVVDYLIDKYGKDRVAGISNYATMASASALRDTGRMFGLSGLDLMATKLVPQEHGQSFALTEAADAVPELSKFQAAHPEIWSHALKLEGCMRSMGRHAAGVIVSGEPLIERSVVETRAEASVVNWDKRTVEDWGLIKMDLLSLATLDVLKIGSDYVSERHGRSIDYLSLSLDDADTMQAFGRGDTTGVFQFESGGMKRLLRSLAEGGALTFEDITAATALYRPGPMDSGLMDNFLAIKLGRRAPRYAHPRLEAVLGDTYGVVTYQEQTMALARELCGFSGTESDFLRRAIGKKDREKMAEIKPKFVAGARAGFVEITLEDGKTATVHRNKKLKCMDGVRRTAEDAFACGIELASSVMSDLQ